MPLLFTNLREKFPHTDSTWKLTSRCFIIKGNGIPTLQSVTNLQSILSSIQLRSPISPSENRKTPSYSPTSIHRVPDVVLVKILSYALSLSPGAPHTMIDPFLSPTFAWNQLETPFPLSHVCRRWMSTVNSTPHLWDSISIFRPNSHHLYRTELWMERVGTHPLTVSLTQSRSPSPSEEETTMQLLEILGSRVRTWKSFEIKITGKRFPKPLVKSLAGLQSSMAVDDDPLSQPLLSAIAITLELNYRPPNNWRKIADPESPVLPMYNLFNFIQSLPSLKFLHWSAMFTPGPAFSNTLETLELHSPISIEELLERIPSFQQLQQLYIHRLSKPNSVTFAPVHLAMDVDVEPVPRRTLPNLRRLGIAALMKISPILQAISTPKLSVLELESRDTIDYSDVRDYLRASGCTLTALGIWPRQMEAKDVAKWVQMKELQSVSGFKMLGVEVDDRILKMLHRPCVLDEPFIGDVSSVTQPRSLLGHTLFPELKELIMGSCNADIDIGQLQRTLGSRFWTVTHVTNKNDGYTAVPTTELRRADIVVRESTSDLSKYADMINMNGRHMKDRPISCLIRTA